MKAKSFYLSLVSIVVFVLFLIFGNIYYNQKLARINEDARTRYAEAELKRAQIEEARAQQSIYEKLAEGEPIHYLVIGGSTGNSTGTDGETWYQYFDQLLREEFGSKPQMTQLSKDGANVFEGLMEYQAAEKDIRHDLVFIFFGENDQNSLKSAIQYQVIYEALIKEVINANPKAEIITVIESSMRAEAAFPQALIELSNHYGIVVADTREAFDQSGENDDALTADGTLPNERGYALYAQYFVDTLQQNVNHVKPIDYLSVTALNDLQGYDNLKMVNQPVRLNGFKEVESHFVADSVDDSMIFQIDGDLLALHLYNEGGILEIYLNGDYFQHLDLSTVDAGDRFIMIDDELDDGEHIVQLVVREVEKEMVIHSIITK